MQNSVRVMRTRAICRVGTPGGARSMTVVMRATSILLPADLEIPRDDYVPGSPGRAHRFQLDEVVPEFLGSTNSESAGCVIGHEGTDAMERNRQERTS